MQILITPARNRCGLAAAVLLAVALCIITLGCSGSSGGGSGDDDDDDDDGPPANVEGSVCDPANGGFSLTIDNPYLPFEVGMVHVLEGMEAGESQSRFQVEVLDETMTVAGVETQVVQKTSWDNEVLVGIERQYLVQAEDGTVCCFGQSEDLYENDAVVGTESWQVGDNGAQAVVFMPADPQVGMVFEMFHDNEDVETGEITHVGESTTTPAGTFDDTITVLEEGPSIKKYAAGIGEIYDDGIELISY